MNQVPDFVQPYSSVNVDFLTHSPCFWFSMVVFCHLETSHSTVAKSPCSLMSSFSFSPELAIAVDAHATKSRPSAVFHMFMTSADAWIFLSFPLGCT